MTQNGDEGKGYVYALLEDLGMGRLPLVSSVTMRRRAGVARQG
jgi:hypothetical protein